MDLKIQYWNCASGLVKKFDFIKERVLSEKLDLFFIAEAEIPNGSNLNFLKIKGYDIVTAKTFVSRPKTRLICFVKHNLFEILDLGFSEFNDLIAFTCKKINIVAAYRGFKNYDGENERSNWVRLFNDLSKINLKGDTFIIGDFNVDINRDDSRFRPELDFWIDSHGMSIIDPGITRRRRVLDNLQESHLDILITNSDKFRVSCEFNDLSDHAVLDLRVRSFVKTDLVCREFTCFDWNFNVESAKKRLTDLLSSKSDMSSNNLLDVDYGIRASLIETFNQFVGTRTFRPRSDQDVFSPKINKLKNRKNRMRKKWLKNNSVENWSAFMKASKILRREVRVCRSKILKKKLSQSSKNFWSEVNILMGKHSRGLSKIISDGIEVSNEAEMSNIFVDYFTGKVNGILGDYEPFFPPELSISPNDCVPFELSEINSAFDRLTNKKTSGMDNISCYFLKCFKDQLGHAILKLFNLILTTGKVPETWKIAKIVPVFKKGSSLLTENYRPVSNLNSIAKLFEICVLQRLEANDIDGLVSTSQHGFRKSHSTETAMASIVGKVSDALDSKLQVSIYSADLTAAFDVLRKEVLVKILIKKGLPMYLIRIIHNYLAERMGYVQIGNARSFVRDIKAGCIQGSVIGPFLFSIYMSELESIVHPHDLIAYADDSYVIIKGNNLNEVREKTQNTMTSHFEWLKSIGMICNQSKTELMFFNNNDISVKVESEEIRSKKCIKVLGILVDMNLKWEPQLSRIISTSRSISFGLRYLRRHIPLSEMKTLIYSHVVSRMLYGSPVWSGNLTFRQRSKLRSAYFRVLRIISRDFNFKLNRSGLLKMCKVEHIDNILFKRSSCFLFNVIFNLSPTDLAVRLMQRSYFNERSLGRLHFFDFSRTRMGKTCFTNQAGTLANTWNFDWFFMTPSSFKHHLSEQLKT